MASGISFAGGGVKAAPAPPAPAPIFKIKQNYRYRLLIKAGDADKALGYLTYINDTYGGGEPSVIIDVNPINMS